MLPCSLSDAVEIGDRLSISPEMEERTMERKSIAALIVTGAMVLGLSACGTNGATSDNADNSQNTNTPVVTEPVDPSNQTQEVEETTPDAAETTPTSQEEPVQETQKTAQPQEETPVPEEIGPNFTEVNETVYATTSVNVRSSYSADSDKVGGLSSGASTTRTGVGDNGWSRIVYGDSVAYVRSDYLTTSKPSTPSKPEQSGNQNQGQSKPKPQPEPEPQPSQSESDEEWERRYEEELDRELEEWDAAGNLAEDYWENVQQGFEPIG